MVSFRSSYFAFDRRMKMVCCTHRALMPTPMTETLTGEGDMLGKERKGRKGRRRGGDDGSQKLKRTDGQKGQGRKVEVKKKSGINACRRMLECSQEPADIQLHSRGV